MTLTVDTQTKGLPLEEVAQQFGDHVEVHLLEGRIVVSSEDQNAYAVTDPATEKNSP
jgi:hypothetical protein